MNRNLIILIIAVVLIGAGVLVAGNNSSQKDKSSVENQGRMERVNSPKTSERSTSLDSNSKYVEYSKETLERSAGARRVLYFYASWCPICIPADHDFRENVNKFPEDLVLIRVNYNDSDTDPQEKDLAKKYAVTYQHTFVQIDSDGKEVKKWNGGQTQELLENIK